MGLVDEKGMRASEELARTHYENFNIAAFFLPKTYRQDLYNIYSFCRLADDFADEISDPDDAGRLLDEWEELLDECVEHDVGEWTFSALGKTIRRRNLSVENFRNLLHAFRMDVNRSRWDTWQELRYYTRHSADPVGRIVLELFGEDTADNFALSDKICTALQLTNHWQDVLEDWKRGRIYIPAEDLKKFHVSEEDIENQICNDTFRELMRFETARAQKLFIEGFPLIQRVGKRTGFQLSLYWTGGFEALRAIKRIDYDVLNKTARLTRTDKIRVGVSAFSRWIMP